MSKLIYGRKGQVRFNSEEEKKEAMEYILTSPNINFQVHENNQDQGAWGPEDRIHIKREEGVPESLKRIKTAGKQGIYGRINCKEFCEELREMAKDKK